MTRATKRPATNYHQKQYQRVQQPQQLHQQLSQILTNHKCNNILKKSAEKTVPTSIKENKLCHYFYTESLKLKKQKVVIFDDSAPKGINIGLLNISLIK